ncbi:conserved domain protein [Campylobacter jejuni RM1221]|nr:hypothetical protein [Campylobacter jejuni]AAW35384.1 conserved domain protein [Campylobacter jejuni RM1221]
MQTTDEDPNINEDDKQASIDEASTQLSGNTCIVSDNFKQEILAQDDKIQKVKSLLDLVKN